MPTLADFQADTDAPKAEFVSLGDVQPDITKHDPNTFAALTAQKALTNLYDQGLQPTGDDIKGIYTKSLDDANSYHSHLAEEQNRAQIELKKRGAAVQSGVLSAEEQTKADIERAKQQQEEQFRQGPSAVAAAAEQEKQGGGKGLVTKLSDTDLARLDGLAQGYDTATNLHNYFDQMATKTVGAGGVIKSGVLARITAPDLTSPEYRNFNANLESSIVPLGRGVFGDAAVAATKENIQMQMKDMLPNPSDTGLSGGQKVYMLKQRIMQNLQTLRDDRVAAGYDTTPIDRQIARINSDMTSTRMTALNPLKTEPVVQNGTSSVGTATMDNQLVKSAQANAQQQQGGPNLGVGQGGVGGVYTPPQPLTTAQPTPSGPVWSPSTLRGTQEAAATQTAQALPGQVLGAVQNVAQGPTPISPQQVGQGIGGAFNWLKGLLPENWNPGASGQQ